jgi:Permuted papain-like amidase enzyme, YaeF/YiiX, C92 family
MSNTHIPIEKIEECDVILSKTNTIVGLGIQGQTIQPELVTNSNWNHAALVVKDEEGKLKVAEALAEGIVIRDSGYYTKPRSDLLDVALLRYKYTLAPSQKKRINRYALSKAGTKYDFLGIAGFLVKIILKLWFNPLADDQRLFCSDYIARAYQKAHIALTPNPPKITSPEDLAKSEALVRIV